MRWKFWEKREGYTDQVINALIQAAEGSAKNAHATAALEAAAGLYQAAFSAAKIEPAQEALGPCFLGEAARRLIRFGQAVYLIEVKDGKIRLRDVASWNIGGGPNEEDWTYSCEMSGPTTLRDHPPPFLRSSSSPLCLRSSPPLGRARTDAERLSHRNPRRSP